MNTSQRAQSWRKPLLIILAALALIATALALILRFAVPSLHQAETTADLDIPGNAPPYHFDYSWSEKSPYIAHALGGILGESYTNSYEAFLLNYQLGQRLFEVDLIPADDGHVVAAHDPLPTDGHDGPVTVNSFLSALTNDKYHRLSFADLVRILTRYPDVYIITDTKYTEPAQVLAQFNDMVQTARDIDSTVLDRFVIQIYNQAMLSTVMQTYPWKSVIYTLYNDPSWTPENVQTFAASSGVKYITMWGSWVTPEIAQLWTNNGIKIAAHTINNLTVADQLRSLGVSNIYTDFLLP